MEIYAGLGVIAAAKAAARQVALRDREKYLPIYRAAIATAVKQGMVLGGTAAAVLAIGEVPEPAGAGDDAESFHLQLYTPRGFGGAKYLANALHAVDPAGLTHYVQLSTIVPYMEFSIGVNARDVVRLTTADGQAAAGAPSGYGLGETVAYPAPFGAEGKIRCVRPELLLVEIYGRLCDPNHVSEWEGQLLIADKLRMKIRRGETGGETDGDAAAGPAHPFRASLWERFVPQLGRVVVGREAVEFYEGGAAKGGAVGGRAQPRAREDHPTDHPTETRPEAPTEARPRALSALRVVTINPLAEEAEELVRLGGAQGHAVRWEESHPNIPSLPRLSQLDVYVVEGKRRLHVLRLYSLQELIPVGGTGGAGGTAYGSPMLVQRLLMAESGRESAALSDRLAVLPLEPAVLFPLRFEGRYVDASREQKRLASDNRGMPPYIVQ